MENISAIEEVLFSLPDNELTAPMKRELRAAKTPDERVAVIQSFLAEHGEKNFSSVLNS